MYMSHIFFVHLSVDEYLPCSHFFTFMKNAINHGSTEVSAADFFHCLWICPSTRISGSHGSSVFGSLHEYTPGLPEALGDA